MWTLKATGKVRTVLLREGWTESEVLTAAGFGKMFYEMEMELEASKVGI